VARSFKIILIYIFVLFLLVLLINSYFKSKIKFNDLNIKKDIISVQNFELSKRFSEGEYYKLTADEAIYSKNNKLVNLKNCKLIYHKESKDIILNANSCEYVLDEKLLVRGDINVLFNGYTLFAKDKDAVGEYSIESKTLKLEGNIVIKDKFNYITAKRLKYYYDKNLLLFKDNVEVKYEISF